MYAYYLYVGVTMSDSQAWHVEHSIETSAPAEAIWRLFRDVAGWPRWNAGIAHIAIDGPFAEGTWFTMQPPGQEPLRSKLLEVRENAGFIDRTELGDLAVEVAHRITPLEGGRTRITYAVDAFGPDAAEIGAAVSSDFPSVLAALAAFAEGRAS
jgi:hypothetical protein